MGEAPVTPARRGSVRAAESPWRAGLFAIDGGTPYGRADLTATGPPTRGRVDPTRKGLMHPVLQALQFLSDTP